MCKTKSMLNTKNKKTEVNNQWAGSGVSGSTEDFKEKTEFSNEWVSTNKCAAAKTKIKKR